MRRCLVPRVLGATFTIALAVACTGESGSNSDEPVATGSGNSSGTGAGGARTGSTGPSKVGGGGAANDRAGAGSTPVLSGGSGNAGTAGSPRAGREAAAGVGAAGTSAGSAGTGAAGHLSGGGTGVSGGIAGGGAAVPSGGGVSPGGRSGSAGGGSSAGSAGNAGSGGGAAGAANPSGGPAPGNPEGNCPVPTEAAAEDASTSDQVVGTGSPESCTSERVVAAVAAGGVITFNCGPAPVTITMKETAVVKNSVARVVIDGGGKVTLSGAGVRRILYLNTCDAQVGWTTAQCDNQATPTLTVQNITFIDGNARWSPDPAPAGTPAGNHTFAERRGDADILAEEGGGAIFAQGGRLKIVNSRFFGNECRDLASDIGGGAVRAFQQYDGQPVYVVNSTFGGAEGMGNQCANGGALSSIGVSWTVINSLFSYNSAVGVGANDGDGGNGGAIYNDGNEMTLRICGSRFEHNNANAHGRAIFFVSNNKTGEVYIDRSVITKNTGGQVWEPSYPQISNHAETPIHVTDSVIE